MRFISNWRRMTAVLTALICGAGIWMAVRGLTAAQVSSGRVEPGFVVHEWGTFTSFSGSDGVPVPFRPLVENDLPPFVLKHPALMFSKGQTSALQRIETPVTYFYPPREMEISASVRITKGMLTEFFPSTEPSAFIESPAGLDWGRLTLIPSQPFTTGQEIRRWEGSPGKTIELPDSAKFAHYDRARATDAAIVRRRAPQNSANQPAIPDDYEKFLFYRGLGNFPLPVSIRSIDPNTVEIRNSGRDPLAAAFLVTVGVEGITSRALGEIGAGVRQTVPLTGTASSINQLSLEMSAALVAAGLYPKEADAMVAAWKDSWFAEPGTRLFYLLPAAVTDEILPLTIAPAPEKIVRVMVGRLEIMTQAQEQTVLAVLTDLAAQRRNLPEVFTSLTGTAPELVPPEIRRLGRLAIPAVNRAAELSGDAAVKKEAARLVESLSVVGAATANEK